MTSMRCRRACAVALVCGGLLTVGAATADAGTRLTGVAVVEVDTDSHTTFTVEPSDPAPDREVHESAPPDRVAGSGDGDDEVGSSEVLDAVVEPSGDDDAPPAATPTDAAPSFTG